MKDFIFKTVGPTIIVIPPIITSRPLEKDLAAMNGEIATIIAPIFGD